MKILFAMLMYSAIFPNDPFATWHTNQVVPYAYDTNYWRYDYQWWLHNSGQDSHLYHGTNLQMVDVGGTYDIGASNAWRYQTNATVLVALVDTGLDTNHPDLSGNIIQGRNFIGRGSDTNVDNLMDTEIHGTHMAGLIAATGNNGVGISGVCWNANLLICKTRLAYDGLGYEEVEAALEYAIGVGARLVYLPWGSEYDDPGLRLVFDDLLSAGVLVVTAVPNRSANLDTFPDYPTCWLYPNVIAVTSVTRDEKLYTGDYSRTYVHLGAPGRVLVTTHTNSPLYAYDSGTSAAAAIVAGSAALVWSQYPNQDWLAVKSRLLSTVKPMSILTVRAITGGALDLGKAMTPETIYLIALPDHIHVIGLIPDNEYELEHSDDLQEWLTRYEFRPSSTTADLPSDNGFFRVRLK